MSQWNADDLMRVSLVLKRNGLVLTPRGITFLSAMQNKISSIALTGQEFVDHIQSVTTYASTFVAECDIKLSEARTVDLARDLQTSDSIPGLSLQICCRCACVVKYIFAFPAVL